MKNIAVISKSDATGGGASRIAGGLVQLLNNDHKFEVHHWVGRPGINSDWYTFKLHGGQWLSLIQGALSIASRTIGLPDFITPELWIHLQRKTVDYDLYHFHDISFTFSPLALSWLVKRKPIIWTFHDCSPFTGGCIYPMDCKAHYDHCNNCPQLDLLPLGTSIDFTGYMQQYKRRLLQQWPIVPIFPSRWLATEAMKAVDFKITPVVIPNYVDTNIYKPLDRGIVKTILGLPQDRFIVLLTATNLSEARKGSNLAIEALKQMNPPPFVLAIGKSDKNQLDFFQGLSFYSTGYIYNDQLLAQYYAAADVFLFPTLADSFGCVAIETMACGTPAIAFATGGVPEIIEHNKTGWLAKTGDVQGLVDGLNYAVNNPKLLAAWRTAGLQKVQERYTKELFLAAHLKIYQKVLNNDYADL
ncbi:glycosyltransferase [Methylomonas sp. LWB]|uniref:glycosyltransferase n=1 Tax=Methylomonas sp. LWB TaxID=1905845 RepID=UPI0009F248A6|nr:glycosyltransferase [Methylomonas sp. LWB]